MPAILIDTNILIYPHDPRDRPKQERAIEIVDALIDRVDIGVSTQCLVEFFNTTTKGLPERMAADQAMAEVERFVGAFEVLPVTAVVVLEACRGSAQHQMAIWDALFGLSRSSTRCALC